jgi:hypothetical protein
MAELHDIILDGVVVTEMEAGVENYVPLDPKLVAELTQGDDNPQFPVICIESGTSKNKFEWPHDVLVDAAEQVNKMQPVGYLGHIRPEDDRYAFPPPQTKWLKAVTKKEGDKTKLYVKGYNLPEPEPIRRYVRMGLVDSTSWKGKASVQHLRGGVQRVTKFALESIDWSRKGKAAMSARLITVAAEMEGEEEVDGLSKVTIAEITAENPSLVELIKRDGAAEAEAKVAEMEEVVEEVEEHRTLMTKLRELLGIDEKVDLLEAVGLLQTKFTDITTKNVKERVGELLKSKVKDDDARAAVLRLIPVNEMEDLEDDALKTKVAETMESDETIKAIVNRFSGAPPPTGKKRDIAEMGDGENDGRYESGKSTSHVKVTRTKL